MKVLFKRLVSVAFFSLLTACVNQGDVATEKVVPVSSPVVQTEMPTSVGTMCPERRPEICTQEYRPVCATLESKSSTVGQKTYSNGCTACADPKVLSYIDGACPK